MHPRLDFECKFWDEDISIGRDDGHFIEFDDGGEDYFAAGLENVGAVVGGFGVRGGSSGRDEVLFKVPCTNVGHYV